MPLTSRLVSLCLLLVIAVKPALAQTERSALLLELAGPIGPATSDFVVRTITRAEREGATFVILRMDTPGGLDSAMREIIVKILAATVPVITYVAPGGARAASAGTYILYASHVAAMAPATNLGAATPVEIGRAWWPADPEQEGDPRTPDRGQNQKTPKEKGTPRGETASSTLERKVVNDAVAYIRGLATLRKRNADWAEQAVRAAASLTAEVALQQGVIDIVAKNTDDLLKQLDGRKLELRDQRYTFKTKGLDLVQIEPDWRNRVLAILTDPNIAYIFMLLGIYGLLFELASPGHVLPGVAGAICLLLAFYAFQVLPVTFAGLALIALGIAFIAFEVVVPSFGALGIGGAVAFVIGSLILMDTEFAAFSVSIPLIVSLGLTSAAFFIGVAILARRNWRRPVVSGREQLIGSVGEAIESFVGRGEVRVQGEIWQARASRAIARGDAVRVRAIDGLVLEIEPANGEN
ncbi:MAG: NfeD family protein [Gammaproteobacteria bacterium]